MKRLSPLDNEVVFKLAFTDPKVLAGLVSAVTGEDLEFGVVETEKRFNPPVGNIDFTYDIFSETTDHRVVVEPHRVEYNYHFDRFLHYHMMAISELQRRARAGYNIEQTVYTIVMVTRPYRKSKNKYGRMIRDEVLISDFDPRNLKGDLVNVFGHKLFFLNPFYDNEYVPQSIREWLDFFKDSIKSPQDYHLPENVAIKLAADHIYDDSLTPRQRHEMKNAGEKQVSRALLEDDVRQERSLKEEALKDKEEAIKREEEATMREEEATKREAEAIKRKEEAMQIALQALISAGISEAEARVRLGLK